MKEGKEGTILNLIWVKNVTVIFVLLSIKKRNPCFYFF